MLQNIGLWNAYQAIAPAVLFGIIAVGQQSEDRVIEGGKIRVDIGKFYFIFHQIEYVFVSYFVMSILETSKLEIISAPIRIANPKDVRIAAVINNLFFIAQTPF